MIHDGPFEWIVDLRINARWGDGYEDGVTDLLGLLHDLRRAVTAGDDVHVVSASLSGRAGVVDLHTGTIYIDPGLHPDDWHATLADGLRSLVQEGASRGDPADEQTSLPITADGGQVIPMPRRLRLASRS